VDGDLAECAQAANVEHKQRLKVPQATFVAERGSRWQLWFVASSRLVVTFALAAMVAAVIVAPAQARRLTPADRSEINSVIDRFVRTAVKRQDPGAAWNLATRELRAGTTRREWERGDIPAYPYPAKGRKFHGWTVVWSERGAIGLDLILRPTRAAKRRIGPIIFDLELRRIKGRWLVQKFLPRASFAPEGQAPRMFSEQDVLPAGGTSTDEARVNHHWILLALALLGLVPLGLIAGWLVLTVRDRRRAGELLRRRTAIPSLPAGWRDRLTARE
jgi:hypothetical protein